MWARFPPSLPRGYNMFKVGDRVILKKIHDIWIKSKHNPVWEEYGIKGTVIFLLEDHSIKGHGDCICVGVRWDNGSTNSYPIEDGYLELELASDSKFSIDLKELFADI